MESDKMKTNKNLIFGLMVVLLILLALSMIFVVVLSDSNKKDKLCQELGYERATLGGIGEPDYCVSEGKSQEVRFSCRYINCYVYKIWGEE